MNETSDLLRFERVSKSFWRGLHETVVVREVDLAVRPGELVVVWGQRGAGKTTLAELAAGLVRPDAGTVRFCGRELIQRRGRSAPWLNEQIGRVRRVGGAADGMAVDRVSQALLGKLSPRRARQSASAMLNELSVGECAEVGWNSLTDGQRTLVALAGALVREPRLVIADDPTAYLNALEREEVMRLLRARCDERGIGVLATVPDMPEMAHADQVGSLSDGRLRMRREIEPENVVELRRREQSG